MPDRPTKEPRPPLASDPDASNSFEVSQELKEMAPLAPLLQKSVEHMKKGNKHQLQLNCELAKLTDGMRHMLRLLWAGALIGFLLLVGLLYALYEQRNVRTMLEANALTQADNVRQMNAVISKLDAAKTVAEETKKAIDKQPEITIKPANTADPTSKPVLVVKPRQPTKKAPSSKGKEDSPPPAPAPPPPEVQIPLDLPPKKK